jgi:hypothetical protein
MITNKILLSKTPLKLINAEVGDLIEILSALGVELEIDADKAEIRVFNGVMEAQDIDEIKALMGA